MKPSPVPAILMFLGVLLLGFGTVSKSWITLGEGGFSVAAGLRAGEICSKEDGKNECKTFSYSDDMGGMRSSRHKLATIAGLAATGAGAVAAILAMICGAMSFGRPPNKVLAILVVCLAGVATVSAFAFLGLMEKPREASFGAGLFTFLGGVTLTLIGSIMLLARRAPGAAAPMGVMPGMPMQSMPMQGPVGMPCPTCHSMTAFVPQYQRYFCTRCNRYV